MQALISRFFPLLLLGIAALVVGSFARALAVNPATKVIPDTTDPSTLKVTVAIDDDQNATDEKVGFTMQFATNEIAGANFIEFTHGESVSCNNTPLTFNSPNYTARVPRPGAGGFFNCIYTRNGQPYPFMHLPVRSNLMPPPLSIQNPNFDITYIPDAALPLCPMNATLSDSSMKISDDFMESRSGRFPTSTTALSGVGSLILTRTCMTNERGIQTASDTVDSHAANPLDSVDITYTSTYRLYETWEPPA